MPQAIRESAERLLSTKDGVFDRSGGRALAKKITDGLLIDIQEAVNGAADAATPILSGLGRKRLMAWVVIDVVRSPVVLDRTAADKAGGRIWLQAQRVSAARIAIADGAAKKGAAARAAAAADPNLEAGLATKLAAVDAAEKLKVSELRGLRSISVSTSWRLLRRRNFLLSQVPAPMRRRSAFMPQRARPPPPAA